MKQTLFVLLLAMCVPAAVSAKKPTKAAETQPTVVAAPEVEEDPVITEECMAAASMFSTSAKNNQYADAYEPWLQVFNECPNYTRATYTTGEKILDWKYSTCTTDEEKAAVKKMMMLNYDKWLRWFGNDKKYPKAYILGRRGMTYCKYFEEDSLKMDAYDWLKESVTTMQKNSQINVIKNFIEVSCGLYKADNEKYAEQFIADYTLSNNLLQSIADDPASKNAMAAAQMKEAIDDLFARSGAASCEKLDELYAAQVKELTNLEDLLKLMKLYKRIRCTESDVYFAAAEKAHTLQPTEESAAGCARMCKKKGDWTGAIDYYMQALTLTEDESDEDIDDYEYEIAYIYYANLKRYVDARTAALRSLQSNPQQGRCYLLIGLCYAEARPFSENDFSAAQCHILNKTVYWAAVDQFKKAKEVDATCAADADKFIASYSKYFPTKEEMFDLANIFNGQNRFLVGGWVNEWTTVRAAR